LTPDVAPAEFHISLMLAFNAPLDFMPSTESRPLRGIWFQVDVSMPTADKGEILRFCEMSVLDFDGLPDGRGVSLGPIDKPGNDERAACASSCWKRARC
jgi:hypothetical protein